MKKFWLNTEGCSGCGACENICPRDAIHLVPDKTGFLYPMIDGNCIDCNACEKVCRNRLVLKQNDTVPSVFAAWSKNSEIRFHSTSGGMFSELSKEILRRGGAVSGAAYSENMVVRHEIATDEEGLAKIRQSKYVQSEIGLVFRDIKKLLLDEKVVCFCGAPCQVAALRSYLGKDFNNLYLLDFICRGVNSPKSLSSWLEEIESEKKSKVTKVWFKYKEGGWKTSPRRTRVEFADGTFEVYEGDKNTFMTGYLSSNLYIRKSCGECKFKGIPRQGDITLADFWGVGESLDDDRGTSLVMVNNPHGMELMEAVKPNIVFFERNLSEVYDGNVCLDNSVAVNPDSELFLVALDNTKFSDALGRYSKVSVLDRFVRKVKKILRGEE